jgi:hypothetical protein
VVGLYNALSNFYWFHSTQVGDFTQAGDLELWPELLPFLLMNEAASVTALAEYTVYRMWPDRAVMSRVQPQLNGVLRNVNAFDEGHKASVIAAVIMAKKYIDSDGKSGHPIAWLAMLDDAVCERIASISDAFTACCFPEMAPIPPETQEPDE